MPYAEAALDLVFAICVLHHVTPAPRAVERMERRIGWPPVGAQYCAWATKASRRDPVDHHADRLTQ
jgi:hypothetical protein